MIKLSDLDRLTELATRRERLLALKGDALHGPIECYIGYHRHDVFGHVNPFVIRNAIAAELDKQIAVLDADMTTRGIDPEDLKPAKDEKPAGRARPSVDELGEQGR